MRPPFIFVLLVTSILFSAQSATASIASAQSPERWWNDAVEAALAQAGPNRPELLSALQQAPQDDRVAVAFLVENMPLRDLQNLTADFLLTQVEQAAEIQAGTPWEMPESLYLNYVLPYANVDEPREPWRQQLNQICKPLIENCQTPAETAQRLNEQLFGKIQVRYSTQRKRANQAPSESMEQGLASCTGLSILLVDACRRSRLQTNMHT